MNKPAFIVVFFGLFVFGGLWANGGYEMSNTGAYEYNASAGLITEPDLIDIASALTSVEYDYLAPDGELGVNLHMGNRLVSSEGGRQVFVLGAQSSRMDLEDMPPLNLCFVIDHSGSMASDSKMTWVHDSFDVLMDTLREDDFISVVQFDNDAQVVHPSQAVGDDQARQRVRDQVRAIQPDGGTNLFAGLQAGYAEVMKNYRVDYANRVIFLTDGEGHSQGMLEMAEGFADMGINVSSIGLGLGFDENLLRELAIAGEGSARFIGDKETMEEAFGSGLSRLVVPIGRDVRISASFPEGSEVRNVWTYFPEFEANQASFSFPTFHVGDYETTVIEVDLPSMPAGTSFDAIQVRLDYLDSIGNPVSRTLEPLRAQSVPANDLPEVYTDAQVIRAGGILDFAQTLMSVGRLYYRPDRNVDDLEQAYGLANRMKVSLYEAQTRLDANPFVDEIRVLEQYVEILGTELNYSETITRETIDDREPALSVQPRVFADQINTLFEELRLSLPGDETLPVVITPFSFQDQRQAPILEVLSQSAVDDLVSQVVNPVISRGDLEAVLEEQSLQLSGLFDTNDAIRIGRLLSARYMVTGTVVEMASSVIVFSRIIDLETSRVLGAAQVVLDKDADVTALL